MRSEVVVVGGGLCGLSAAWSVARRGRQVILVDQAATGHTGGGSHGSCRIFRFGYEDPRYVPLVRQARQVWTELEAASGERLLEPTPQLTFGPLVGQVKTALEQAGAPIEVLTQADAAGRFSGVALSGAGEILYEPESAVIRADRALAVLAARVQPQVRQVTGLAASEPGVQVSLAGGDKIDAEVAIVCAGPWTGRLVAGTGISVPGRTSFEQVAFFAPAPARGAAPAPLPIMINYGATTSPYGLPVPGTNQYKLGIHFGGPTIDPDDQVHAEDVAMTGQIQRAVAEFLPGLDPVPVAVERCIYDISPDTNFIIDRIGNVVIGCGTSGHGFKFGPLIGEWLAELAVGPGQGQGAGLPPAWFGLSRFA
ncbi:MAG TPA: FAD-dependent oxidoreductase [Streptosporangiaceae bacterium]